MTTTPAADPPARHGVSGPAAAPADRTVEPTTDPGGEPVTAQLSVHAGPAPDRGAGDGPVYDELVPVAEAAAIVASVINVALAAERGRQDLSSAFRLLPVLVDEVSAAGRPYQVLAWGVFVADPDYAGLADAGPYAELVSYGAVRQRRDGHLRYDPRGLHEPIGDAELPALRA